MKPHQYWQNFELGKELDIAGGFVYDGLRNLHEIESLYYEAEIFSVLYNLSVGLERFLKVAVVLIEYSNDIDGEEFEKSLITHNHLELLNRVKAHYPLNLGKVHNDLLSLLAKFYKTYRYDRYGIATVYDLSKEKKELHLFLKKYLKIDIDERPPFKVVENNAKTKKFIGKSIAKLCKSLYEVISTAAKNKNLYTYELRTFSKSYKLIYGSEFDFNTEEILWRELLIFMINTKQKSAWLDHIHAIEPLDFDVGLMSDYLQCFSSDTKKIDVSEELEHLYSELENIGERIKMVEIIGDP